MPVGGVPLLDHWLRALRGECEGLVGPMFVVSNERHAPAFREWSASHGLGCGAVINNSSHVTATSEGSAVADLALCLRERRDVIAHRDVLVWWLWSCDRVIVLLCKVLVAVVMRSRYSLAV